MIEVQIIRTDVMLNEALALRVEVFVDEQKVPKTEEVDYLDNVSSIENKKVIHIVALFQQRIVGTARLIFDVPENEYPHIGRVAVKKEFRGRNIGRTIMDQLHQIAKKKLYDGVTLSAQIEVRDFYTKLGYVPRGSIYMDVGIPHQDMDYVF